MRGINLQSGYKYPFPSLVAVCQYIMLPEQLSPTNRGITWQIKLSVSKMASEPGACVSFKFWSFKVLAQHTAGA